MNYVKQLTRWRKPDHIVEDSSYGTISYHNWCKNEKKNLMRLSNGGRIVIIKTKKKDGTIALFAETL